MPMKPYPILCYSKNCGQLAAYKIASRWSDGITKELKTYSLACEKCLPSLFADALIRHKRCHLSEEETLESPTIFELILGTRDRFLNPRLDVVDKLRASASH
jgi:hypothetical protein